MRAFKLLREMPDLGEGAVFVYDQHNESGLGSPALGCLILAWDNGNCQQNRWCGGTFILPGQLHQDQRWFKEILNPEAAIKPKRYYVDINVKTFSIISVS